MGDDYTKIRLGNIELEEVRNIVREIKHLWQYVDNVWPGGDRKLLPDIKITRNKQGIYHAHMNAQALTYLLIFCKNIQPYSEVKQDVEEPMPPGFLLADPKPE
jgi:hypothetical protein